MIARLIPTLAFAALCVSATPAHAGWFKLRSNLKQQKAQQQAQRKLVEEQNRLNGKQREEADRWTRRQRGGQAIGVKQYSAQMPSSNYKVAKIAQRVVQTLAARLGGSRGLGTRVSTTRALLLRRAPASGPEFGFKHVAESNWRASSGSGPQLFAFNRY